MELILNNIDIKTKFANLKETDEFFITTDIEANGNLRGTKWGFEWMKVVELGVKKIVTKNYLNEHSLFDYDKVTAVCFQYYTEDGFDFTEQQINHNSEIEFEDCTFN